ncbi:MAG TPA: hypothetical protein VFS30_09385 [Dehalococcoidia bacterium]|nr:hypothetical protein [Dehalococcoidia bacterium]
MKSRLGSDARKAMTGRRILVAAAAATAAASAWETGHRRVRRADLTESGARIEKLSDLRYDQQALKTIASGLEDEWGEFAYLGFKDLREMMSKAGDTIFVVVERDETGAKALGIVQTILADVHGDAELLQETYPDFAALTSPAAWKRSRTHGGDTVVLLQITTLVKSKRSSGTGSLLRNAALNMLDARVSYALTTTPVDGALLGDVDVELPKTYTAAMRFHARGGASPARTLPGYKRPQGDATEHGEDVVMMRYARDESGEWPAPRPEMRLRSMGPMQRRVNQTARQLRLRRLGKLRPPRTPLSDLRASGQRFLAKRPARQFLTELRGRVARRIHGHDDDVAPAA